MDNFEIENRRAFDNWKVAGPLSRTLAFLIDGLLVFTLLYGFLNFSGNSFRNQTSFWLFWVLMFWCWEGLWVTLMGSTPARKAFGLKVHSPRTDGLPHPLQVCLRILIFWLTAPLLGLGVTPILYRKDRRGWHDIVAETITVGPQKSIPTPFMNKFGYQMMIGQSLTVLSTLGAIFAFQAVKLNQPNFNRLGSCDQPQLLLENPQEVLTAMSISPAWKSCWNKLYKNLSAISDSKLVTTAHAAYSYQSIWSINTENKKDLVAYLENQFNSAPCSAQNSDGTFCQTARHLASISNNTEINNTGSWTLKYHNLIKESANSKDREERINFLKQHYNSVTNEIVKTAIADRLFAEELASGIKPTSKPNSMNKQWNKEQYCWLELYGYNNNNNCQDRDQIYWMSILNNLRMNNLTETIIESHIVDLEEVDPESDMIKLFKIALARKNNETTEIQDLFSRFSVDSPLYPIALSFTK